jgi:hypothetical protein
MTGCVAAGTNMLKWNIKLFEKRNYNFYKCISAANWWRSRRAGQALFFLPKMRQIQINRHDRCQFSPNGGATSAIVNELDSDRSVISPAPRLQKALTDRKKRGVSTLPTDAEQSNVEAHSWHSVGYAGRKGV